MHCSAVSLLVAANLSLVTCFAPINPSFCTRRALQHHHTSPCQLLRYDASSFLTSVEFFDGSQITNPVIVSNVFWSSLQANILSFVMAQLIATGVFLLLLVLFSTQLTQLMEFINNDLLLNKKQPLRVPEKLRVNGDSRPPPDYSKLLVCIGIDIIGSSSELIPILGELSDILWAPLAALLLRQLFGKNNILAVLEFTEEILPLTDILPLATLCWAIDTFGGETAVAKLLRLGAYRKEEETPSREVKTSVSSVLAGLNKSDNKTDKD